ncbi:hypothetical protein [Ornithinimicrobium kibberense]
MPSCRGRGGARAGAPHRRPRRAVVELGSSRHRRKHAGQRQGLRRHGRR